MIKSRIEKGIKNQKAGIYIHIPFCVRKCEYCDFLSGPGSEDLKKKYSNALEKEIKAAAVLYPGYEICTVFFGGGTPSILPPENIRSILGKIGEQFSLKQDAEITIEANPGTLDHKKLSTYREAGINRLSIGLQSANNEELKILGRIHTFEEFLEGYHMARDLGFKNINVDLMSGLPGQEIKGWKDTLRKVISLNPEHISAYGLIIEEGTPFYKKYHNENGLDLLPDEDAERDMYDLTNKMLKENGYQHYEISNYSKPGFACKHNLSYWERENYLGLGTGAASLMEHVRFSNTSNISDYIKHSSDLDYIRKDVTVLSRKEEVEEFMFLGLRTMKGVSVETFFEDFETSFWDIYGGIFEKLEKEKLLETVCLISGGKKAEFIRLTNKGIDVSNYVMAQFLLD